MRKRLTSCPVEISDVYLLAYELSTQREGVTVPQELLEILANRFPEEVDPTSLMRDVIQL